MFYVCSGCQYVLIRGRVLAPFHSIAWLVVSPDFRSGPFCLGPYFRPQCPSVCREPSATYLSWRRQDFLDLEIEMPGVKSTTIDKTGGGGRRSGAPGVRSTEIDKSGGAQNNQGAPGVKVTEKDLSKKKDDPSKK
jgi:hypothetical protein